MTNLFKSIDSKGHGGDGGGGQKDPLLSVPFTHPRVPTAIVIGTGFGGLAAAIRLSAKGYCVQELEKLNGPGGHGRRSTKAPVPRVPFPHPRFPTAIVIGTGFGGLAAAIRLSVKGYRVQVLEKLYTPGGPAYVLNQNGFTFDAGPTTIPFPHFI